MQSPPRHALVVGGGIIGLTSAFRLASEGWRVTLFDPDPGSGATWAAAGMIAPAAEAEPGEESNFQLQRGAVGAWRELARELERVTDETLDVVERGTLVVGYDASDRRLVEQLEDVATGYGAVARWLSRRDEPASFFGVSARLADGLLLDGDAWLDPDHAVALLTRANDSLGVTTIHAHVHTAAAGATSVQVTTSEGTTRGDVGLIATGARGLPDGLAGPRSSLVRPVRGMTVRLQGLDRSDGPTLRAFVRGRSLYLVSRPGGYCVLGASSDERPELLVEVGELQRLLRDALDVMPDLEAATIVETRQGFRPASSNHSPFYEVVEGRWLWSSGHYRHGVTLAPPVARENVRLLMEMS